MLTKRWYAHNVIIVVSFILVFCIPLENCLLILPLCSGDHHSHYIYLYYWIIIDDGALIIIYGIHMVLIMFTCTVICCLIVLFIHINVVNVTQRIVDMRKAIYNKPHIF